MTLHGYQSHLKLYRRYQVVCGLAFYALLLAVAVPTLIVIKRIDNLGLDRTGVIVLTVSYCVVAGLMFCVMAWLPRRRLRQLELICPNCRRRLTGLASKPVAATGCCGFCGDRVVEEIQAPRASTEVRSEMLPSRMQTNATGDSGKEIHG